VVASAINRPHSPFVAAGFESATSTRAENRFEAALSRRAWDFLASAALRFADGESGVEAGFDCAFNAREAPRNTRSATAIVNSGCRARSLSFTIHPSLAY
jgi:hypothetical protein